jgi:hypothetical protein
LSDIWEALIAAIFIDGGWKALHETIGCILEPYIFYFL